MREGHSRRQVLAMVARTPPHAVASSAVALESTNSHQVRNYKVSLASAGGGIKVQLTSALAGEVFDIELQDAETRGHFMKLLELAVAGRGRMSLEVDRDNNTIRTFVLEVP